MKRPDKMENDVIECNRTLKLFSRAAQMAATLCLLTFCAVSARGAITVDAIGSTNSTTTTVSLTIDASGSDKLVVVVTGEHGFNNMDGDCTAITYDGVSLTQAVDRNPAATNDITYNDIWYLDAPSAVHTGGVIVATVVNRGSMTAFALSGTGPGVGAVAISAQASKSVALTTTMANSIVIASHGMGGDGNTADVDNVDAVEPLIEASARRNSFYDGHVTGYMLVSSPGLVTAEFTGGNTLGTHTIAAEFPPAPPAGTVIVIR